MPTALWARMAAANASTGAATAAEICSQSFCTLPTETETPHNSLQSRDTSGRAQPRTILRARRLHR